ncbi:hypothetical protein ACQPXM_17710 [Kribbella sp. CA-253562]|uniref:hypothetical protein n=1 Tax=Kribbella sp. CA-253562 TaxID=3239942 RepID=UPI003D8BB905
MGTPGDETAVAELWMSVDGKDWRDVSSPVQSVDVEDHDRLTDKATVVLDDNTGVLADASFEGLEVRITLGWKAQRAKIFEGVVSAARVIAAPGGQRIELTALDFTHRMSKHTPTEPVVWNRGETLTKVLTDIVTRAEYRIKVGQIEPTEELTFDKTRALRQANVNDWAFVLDLAERQNCLAFLEFDGKNTSEFFFVPIEKVGTAKPVGTLSYCRGMGDLVEFDFERISSGALPTRSASTIDPASGAVVDAPAAPPAPRPELPAPGTGRDPGLGADRRAALESLTELAAAADAKLAAPTERVAGAVADPGAAKAKIVPDPTRRLGFSGRGVATGNVLLRAKSRVSISGISAWAAGDWYLTKVNHVYRRERSEHRSRASYFTKFAATR